MKGGSSLMPYVFLFINLYIYCHHMYVLIVTRLYLYFKKYYSIILTFNFLKFVIAKRLRWKFRHIFPESKKVISFWYYLILFATFSYRVNITKKVYTTIPDRAQQKFEVFSGISWSGIFNGVFRTQSNIKDGAFSENN